MLPSTPGARRNVVESVPLDQEHLENMLSSLSREPFTQELARFLISSPAQAKIREFAEKYPDRWAQAVAILARLTGYSEKIDVDVSGTIRHVRELSDVDLAKRLEQIESDLQSLVEGTEKKEIITIEAQAKQ